jgi:hypothetical protein
MPPPRRQRWWRAWAIAIAIPNLEWQAESSWSTKRGPAAHRLRQAYHVEERAKVPEFWMQSPRVKQAVERETCWMFTYVGAEDINNVTPESVRLRLALLRGQALDEGWREVAQIDCN